MLHNEGRGALVENSQESDSSAIAAVAQSAMAMIDGISLPSPVRRNALKAFDQLCAAIVDIPVAYLEGFSESKRAENSARAALI